MASAALAIQAGLEVIEVTFTLRSAARAIERLRHDCQPPVSGIVKGPALYVPFTSMWNVPP